MVECMSADLRYISKGVQPTWVAIWLDQPSPTTMQSLQIAYLCCTSPGPGMFSCAPIHIRTRIHLRPPTHCDAQIVTRTHTRTHRDTHVHMCRPNRIRLCACIKASYTLATSSASAVLDRIRSAVMLQNGHVDTYFRKTQSLGRQRVQCHTLLTRCIVWVSLGLY